MDKMYEHQDIFSVTLFFYQACRWLGFAPYIMTGPPKFRRLKYSRTYDVITSILHIIGLVLVLVILNMGVRSKSQITMIFATTYSLIAQVNCVITILLNKLYNSKYIAIWNDLHKIEIELKKIGVTFEYKRMKLSLFLPLFAEFLFFLIYAASVLYYIRQYTAKLWISFHVLAIFYYITVVPVLVINHFCVFVTMSKYMFRKLNAVIASKFCPTKGSNQKLSKLFVMTDSEILKKVANVHQSLCEIVRRGNRTLSVPTLIFFGMYFCILVIHCMNIVRAIFAKRMEVPHYLIVNVIVVAYAVARIGTTIYVSEECMNEMNLTKKIVYHNLTIIEEPFIKDELHAFSLQICHEDVEITAGGFFIVGYPLIISILGALGTYIVILVQLDPNANFYEHFVRLYRLG